MHEIKVKKKQNLCESEIPSPNYTKNDTNGKKLSK